SACSLFQPTPKGREELAKQLKNEKNEEIVNQLSALGSEYINFIGDEALLGLSLETKKYLNAIYNAVVTNNELVFEQEKEVQFFVVKQDSPFHFSLPNGHIFLSTGLLRKYITSEDLLVAVLSFEIFRS